eukprot:TRINITY_DN3332_c0_g1_i1.p1 TRINITY_DN3332_c0_g1~~TRINITY_DN3332_c0_g1_i1.p1  ORF type:complete len:115 (-),score=17.65 TRINITY_DN3332_c0_g1_i1:99-443(-)
MIRYQAYQSPIPVIIGARDFVLLRKRFNMQNTNYYQSDVSITYPPKPVDTYYVRGRVLSSGYVFEPLQEGGGCHVTYVAQVDPAGFIPSWVVNLGASKMAKRIADIQKLCDEAN